MSTQRVTWRDVLDMPEDGLRYEAIGGVLYVTPMPTLRHQWISGNLTAALRRLVMEPGLGYVFQAPLGVEFPVTNEGVQPDITVVARSRRDLLVKDGIRGAPDVVVEIMSSWTERQDKTIKRDLYRRQGVETYWIVDPGSETVEVWDFGESVVEPLTYDDELPLHIHGIRLEPVNLAEIFSIEIPTHSKRVTFPHKGTS